MSVTRIELLGVPVDICKPEDLKSEISKIIAKPGTRQIVFLTVWDLLKARRKRSDFKLCLRNADLILPVSKSILKGAKFLKLPVPVRYNPFEATIELLNCLDEQYKSLYLLGSRKKTLMQAERNVHATFSNMKIVGRYVGYYPKSVEKDVISAIFKAAPTVVLYADGIKDKNLWFYRRRENFKTSTFLYYRDSLGIFSSRVKRVSKKTFDRGLEIWNEILHNPFKLFLILPYMRYKILLLWYRLFRSSKRSNAVKEVAATEPVQASENSQTEN